MKQIILTCVLTVSAIALFAACGGGDNSNANRSNVASAMSNAANTVVNTAVNAANTVAKAASSATTSSPSSFMEEAAQGGLAEVELGRLAVAKAKDPEVKKYGQMMIDDHTKANADLKTLAGSKKMTLPPDMGPNKKTYDKLNGLSGADFDKAYVDDMVDDHETDVAAFQKQADNGTDPEVKAFAAKTLPVLKKHLDAIKAIKAKMK